MKISVCIPCMNRADDLKWAMPRLLAAASISPPIEVVVLDYNSQDRLADYMATVCSLVHNVSMIYRRYEGRDYYHMAHARNLAMLEGTGDYLLSFMADISMAPDYLQMLRGELERGIVWAHHSDRFVGVICVDRQEFVDAGGYDERFEFYGKEDKDLLARLHRRGASHIQIPDWLTLLPTPWPKKLENYRGGLGRRQMGKLSKAIYQENNERGVLVANEGKDWGSWNEVPS